MASYAEQVKSLSEKGTLLTIKEFLMKLNFFYLGYKVTLVFALKIKRRVNIFKALNALLSRKYLALIVVLLSHHLGNLERVPWK